MGGYYAVRRECTSAGGSGGCKNLFAMLTITFKQLSTYLAHLINPEIYLWTGATAKK
jgi:hypothetical protein